jgi:hypothetical protein
MIRLFQIGAALFVGYLVSGVVSAAFAHVQTAMELIP